jgi:hypothetical protein
MLMGHATSGSRSTSTGHLLPGVEDEAAELLDAFLASQFGYLGTSAPCASVTTVPSPEPDSFREWLQTVGTLLAVVVALGIAVAR